MVWYTWSGLVHLKWSSALEVVRYATHSEAMSSPTAISCPVCVYSFVCTRCNQLSSSQSVVRRTSPAHYHSPNWQSVTGRVPPISAVVINKSADVFVGEREGEETRAEQSQWTSQLLWISLTSLSLSPSGLHSYSYAFHQFAILYFSLGTCIPLQAISLITSAFH